MDFLNHMLKKHRSTILGVFSVILLIAIYLSSTSFAVGPFPSGTELDPACEPGDVGCIVTIASGLGEENATDKNISIGTDAAGVNTVGLTESIFIGTGAGENMLGSMNIGIGNNVLSSTTSANASSNIAIGANTLFSNTEGDSNVAIGHNNLSSNTYGSGNVAVGASSLVGNTTASNNIAVGRQALQSQGTFDNGGVPWDSDNVAIGVQALNQNQPTSTSDGYQNTALGNYSLFSNTTGSNNTASGFKALYTNDAGGFNAAFGHESLFSNTSGGANVASGYHALYANISGESNTATGSQSMTFNTTGNENVASGRDSLFNNTSGSNNVAIGHQSAYSNTTARKNVALGADALFTQSFSNSGTPWDSDNVAVGYAALRSNQPTSTSNGIQNTATGAYSLYSNTTGTGNTGNGYASMILNETGSNNTAYGFHTLHYNLSGNNNTVLGYEAGYNSTGSSNVFLGHQAGRYETGDNFFYVDNQDRGDLVTQQTESLLYGFFDADPANQFLTVNGNLTVTGTCTGCGSGWSLTGNASTVDGTNFIGTTDNIPLSFRVNNEKSGRIDPDSFSTFLGYQAGNIDAGINNTGFGYVALSLNSTGNNNTAFGRSTLAANDSGSENTAIGGAALFTNTQGNQNTAIGKNSLGLNTIGNTNTALGYNAGFNSTGDGNIFIGYNAGKTNGINSNELWIDNTDDATPLIFGDFSTGEVGIGTVTPVFALDVAGAIRTSEPGSGIVGDSSMGLQLFPAFSTTVSITLKTDGKINFTSLPAYDDDAAAGVGGLVTGDLFQTTGAGAITTAGVVMIKQ